MTSVSAHTTTILQRIAQGDQSAVAACIEEYGNTIWSIANRYLARMGEDVEDAVQEVFVEVWKSAARFDPALGSEPAFIATIAHRRLINRQRKAAAHRSVALESVAEPGRVELKDHASLRDEARVAAEAFETLQDDEKHLLWLSIHKGFTHEKIAQETSLPLGTVKTRIRRGLLRLREVLAGRSPQQPQPAGGHA